MRLFKKISLGLFILLLVFVAYTLITVGFFRKIENKFAGDIIKKINLPGAEDLTISLSDSFALISSTNRGTIYPPEDQEKGGLYYLDLKNESYVPVHLTKDFEKPFAPHGISIFKMDSTYTVMAINHTLEGHSIEVFTLDRQQLRHEYTLTDPMMVSPNDLVLLGPNEFYFTNDHGYTEGLGKLAEEYLGLAVSNVIYFDGTNYREVAKGIAYANGINFDVARNLLFVASPRGMRINVYQKATDGSLDFIEDISCGTGVDNLELDQAGNIWSGCHPKLLRFAAYAKGKKKTAPSEIIKVEYRGTGDYDVESVYLEDGETMSGASVAAPFGDLILTGNVKDKQFLILQRQ